MSATWDQAEPITFTSDYDPERMRHRLTVDGFPEVTTFSDHFLDAAEDAPDRERPWVVCRPDRTVRIEADNGWCTYRLVDYRPWLGLSLGERLGPA